MTTRVTITACCSKDKEVHALIVDQLSKNGVEVVEDIVLQDGESAERYVYDGRIISVQEVEKAMLKSNSDDASIENEILAKGLTAPRITPADIVATIALEQYFVFPGTTLTVCCLTLQNGFQVTGESACASPENFDLELGQKIAKENAKQKIWALEGYLLKSKLAAQR